jgi:hypothetical protein
VQELGGQKGLRVCGPEVCFQSIQNGHIECPGISEFEGERTQQEYQSVQTCTLPEYYHDVVPQ